MKRMLLLAFALLAVVVQGMAQVTFEFPKFTKLLQVQSKGINVRAEPSTQSAKVGNGPEMLLVIDEMANTLVFDFNNEEF